MHQFQIQNHYAPSSYCGMNVDYASSSSHQTHPSTTQKVMTRSWLRSRSKSQDYTSSVAPKFQTSTRSAVTPSPGFQNNFQINPNPPQSQSPAPIQKYIENHPILSECDNDSAYEICQGAAALYFMSNGVQVNNGRARGLDAGPSRDKVSNRHLENGKRRKRNDGNHDRTDSSSSDGFVPILHSNSFSSVSSFSRKKSRKHPKTLATPSDKGQLNSLHCFVRSECLEIFTVPGVVNNISKVGSTRRDASSSRSTMSSSRNSVHSNGKDISSSTRLFPGRVGLQCSFCAHVPHAAQHTMASFHPKRLDDLYRSGKLINLLHPTWMNLCLIFLITHLFSVCTWQRVHFKECAFVPPQMRKKYQYLKEADKTRGKTKYWVRSAQQIGLMNVKGIGKGGISF